MSQASLVIDGDFTSFDEADGPEPKFPFENNPVTPDVYARLMRRVYEGDRASYAPHTATRTSWTNLFTYSEALTNAAWTASEITVADNIRANPADGLVTMARFLETVTNAGHYLSRADTYGLVQHTISAIVAGGLGRDFVRLYAAETLGSTVYAVFDLTLGRVVATSGSVSAAIVAFDDGSFRISITLTLSVSGFLTVRLGPTYDATTVFYAGDTTKGIYAWALEIKAAASAGPYVSTTSVARTVSAPEIDIDDPFAYLLEEEDPGLIATQLLRARRLFGRIPKQQIVPSTINVTRPAIPAAATYDLYRDGALVKASAGILYSDSQLCDFSSGIDYGVYGAIRTITNVAQTKPTSGTWTFTYRTSTATFNYNDTAATVAAAINALAAIVSDGITVSGAGGGTLSGTGQVQITVTAGHANWASHLPTMNGAGLSPALSQEVDLYATAAPIYLVIVRTALTIAAHGIASAATDLALRAVPGATVINLVPQGNWSIYDANTLRVKTAVVTSANMAAPFQRTYTPGVAFDCRCQNISDFYLPAVTSGVATFSDIPRVTSQADGDAFLQAVFAGSASINYQVGGVAPWHGPIFSRTVVRVDATDL